MLQSPAVTVRRVGRRLMFEIEGCQLPAIRGGNEGAACGCGGTCDTCSAPPAPAEHSPLLTAVWEAGQAGWLTLLEDGSGYNVTAANLADHETLLRQIVQDGNLDEADAVDAITYALATAPTVDPEPPAAEEPAAAPLAEPGPLQQALTAATAGREEFDGYIPTSWGHLPAREYATRQALRQTAQDAILDWAETERAAIRAAAGDGMEDVEGRWHAYLFVEGIRTSDNRAVALGAMSWRDLPLPLEWARAYEGGHYGKVVVGAVESVERVDGPMGMMLWYGEGSWDLGGDDGAECARQVQLQGGTRFVSADVEVLKSHLETAGGNEVDLMDMLFGDSDEEWYDVLDEGRGMGATVVSTPAFPQCVIAPMSVELQQVEPMVQEPTLLPDLVASGAPASPAVRVREPAPDLYFQNPAFARDDRRLVEVKDRTGRVFRGCPATVEDDGRYFGHVALWGFCHTGFTQECVLAPRSRTGYAYFLTGEYRTDEGRRVPVGQLTIGTKHAEGYLRYQAATRHYDDTGMAFADVTVGEDEYGIWAAGLLRPKVKLDGQLRQLDRDDLRIIRATGPSGDWRLVGGSMELVACLNVNVQGFPVPRVGLAASAGQIIEASATEVFYDYTDGERRMVSLIAAGTIPRHPIRDAFGSIHRELAELRAEVTALRPLRDRYEQEQQAEALASLEARLQVG